jgi:hypothetical protein
MTLTDPQVAAAFEALLGLPPRAADLAALRVLHPDLSVAELARYLWDHFGGEPDEPTLEQVEAAVRKALSPQQRVNVR